MQHLYAREQVGSRRRPPLRREHGGVDCRRYISAGARRTADGLRLTQRRDGVGAAEGAAPGGAHSTRRARALQRDRRVAFAARRGRDVAAPDVEASLTYTVKFTTTSEFYEGVAPRTAPTQLQRCSFIFGRPHIVHCRCICGEMKGASAQRARIRTLACARAH